MRYRWKTGFWAWLLMRVSGGLIVVYLFMHLWVLSGLSLGKESFDGAMEILQNPILKLFELGLFGCVLYHALNGIRVCIMDLGYLVEKQRGLFWGVVVVGLVIFVVGSVPVLMHL